MTETVFVHFPAGISKGAERQNKARQRSRLRERVGYKQDIHCEFKSRSICRGLLLLILVLSLAADPGAVEVRAELKGS